MNVFCRCLYALCRANPGLFANVLNDVVSGGKSIEKPDMSKSTATLEIIHLGTEKGNFIKSYMSN